MSEHFGAGDVLVAIPRAATANVLAAVRLAKSGGKQ